MFSEGNAIKFSMLFILSLSLIGCGKKIPECGDALVQDSINKLASQNFDKSAEQIGAEYLNQANDSNPNDRPFELVSSKAIYNQKLDGFASQRQDKESGKNFCTAMNYSQLTFEVKLKLRSMPGLTDDKTVSEVWLDGGAQAVSSPGVDVKVEDNMVVIRAKSPVPQSINYSTQETDKGDKIIVSFGEK